MQMTARTVHAALMVSLAVLLLAPAGLALQPAPPAEPGQPGRPDQRRRGPQAMPARMQVAVYELRLPIQQASKFDVDALGGSLATPADLCAALSKLGATTLRYQFDQRINLLSHEKFSVASTAPFCAGTVRTDSGQDVPKVEYKDVGCQVETHFRGFLDEARECLPCCQVEIEVASFSLADVPGAGELQRHRISKARLQYVGPPAEGKPQIVYGWETTPAVQPSEVIVYLAWILIQPT
jgi:hypothetical protein